jgi:CDP-glucose 4,6-dehydratase
MENLVEKLYATFKNKNIILTGHTGFKGSWLSQWLLKMGANVIGISKDISSNPSMFEDNGIGKAISEDIRLNVLEEEKMLDIFNRVKPDFVFHLAAQPIVSLSYKDPVDTFLNNTIGYATVLNAFRKLEGESVMVMASSDKCYANKEWIWGYRENDALGGYDPYSASKATSEIVFNSFYHSYYKNQNAKRISSVRAGNVIGGGDWSVDRIIPDAYRAWQKKETLLLRRPNSIRPWQFVLEPLFGYLLTAMFLQQHEHGNGECFNFGPDNTVNLTVAAMIGELSALSGNGKFAIDETGATFYETSLLKLNADKAKSLLGWFPVTETKTTLSLIAEWYSNYENNRNQFDLTMAQIDFFEKEIIHKS